MPRRNRNESPTGVYHFICRGVNKKTLFHKEQDFETFLDLIMEHKSKLGIDIFHYCLMSNHAHILLKAPSMAILSRFGHYVQRRYAYYYCGRYNWPEQVFRKRFHALTIEKDAYLLECGRYIERNPVRAGLVGSPGQYHFSSYKSYAGQMRNALITLNPLYKDLGRTANERMAAYRDYVETERAYERLVDQVLVPF